MKRDFYRWLKVKFPGIRLKPWQRRVVAVYFEGGSGAGKTFLLQLLACFDGDDNRAEDFFAAVKAGVA